jgi:hypothetical protein
MKAQWVIWHTASSTFGKKRESIAHWLAQDGDAVTARVLDEGS